MISHHYLQQSLLTSFTVGLFIQFFFSHTLERDRRWTIIHVSFKHVQPRIRYDLSSPWHLPRKQSSDRYLVNRLVEFPRWHLHSSIWFFFMVWFDWTANWSSNFFTCKNFPAVHYKLNHHVLWEEGDILLHLSFQKDKQTSLSFKVALCVWCWSLNSYFEGHGLLTSHNKWQDIAVINYWLSPHPPPKKATCNIDHKGRVCLKKEQFWHGLLCIMLLQTCMTLIRTQKKIFWYVFIVLPLFLTQWW